MNFLTNMKPMHKALLVGVLHIVLLFSLCGKMLMDRATKPRVWVQTVGYDPNSPLRGRYVMMQVLVKTGRADIVLPDTMKPQDKWQFQYTHQDSFHARLEVRDNELWAVPSGNEEGPLVIRNFRPRLNGPEQQSWVLSEPVDFYIPEHALDPTLRNAGEETWVEVTIPKRGGPRPIQMGVKKNGAITPIGM